MGSLAGPSKGRSANINYEKSHSCDCCCDGGNGDGGNITIDPQYIILDNALVQASALNGDGGNINFIITGNGDVIEPEHDLMAIGSGGPFAQAAALALLKRREDLLEPLADALRNAAEKLVDCPECGNIDTVSPCAICALATPRSRAARSRNSGPWWAATGRPIRCST